MELNFTKQDYNAIVRIQETSEKIMARMRERAKKNENYEIFTLSSDYKLEDDPIYLALKTIESEAEMVIEMNY